MKSLFGHQKSFWLTVVFFFCERTANLLANPSGLSVTSGSATAQQLGSQLNITVGQTAILNWQSFNIAAGETTSFLQPSANSVVFNVIGGSNPSQIFGNLNANGTVILANASGFYFGPNSMIKVGGSFIATTAPLAPDFGSGGMWLFTGMPPLASIVNYGQIEVGQGRSLYLIAEEIENHGALAAPGGQVDLAAGQSVLVCDSADGRGLSAAVQLPAGSVDNFGRITADAGTIALQARVVNQDGILQANSIQNQNGEIELVASDSLNLGANSQISAQGDDNLAGSPGGRVTLQSGDDFSDSTGSGISVAGGAQGGNGGALEISAPNITSLNSSLDARAADGWTAGTFFLDPVNLTLGTSSANGVINVNTAFSGFSSILLQATGNITFNTGTSWNLSSSTGEDTGQLTLQAGGNIVFGKNSQIYDANDWNVSLAAGFAGGAIQPGVGSIYLNGSSGGTLNGTITTGTGNIDLQAGQDIQVGTGSVFTMAGGSIFARAVSGNLMAGTFNGGTGDPSNPANARQTTDYFFSLNGATPNPILGGMSTADGGNVTLIAGNNIDSTPKVPSGQAPGASGAYGAGDVTVIAGSQITGNYTLANGTGTLLAGVQVSDAQAGVLQMPASNPSACAGTLAQLEMAVMNSPSTVGNVGAAPVAGAPSTAPVTLGLISGAWNVWAANDISIKEVNNPNGAFNTLQSFLYDYAPDASANFWAGNAIELTGANLGRLSSLNSTPIYAPVLSLDAGSGGIQVDKSIILDPSSEGSLSIITRDGGNLSGAVTTGSTVLNGITMSDSDSANYSTFASGHAAVPLHLDDPNPVTLDISGSINSFSLTVPTFANINVAGNTYNFAFTGRNLSAAQTTAINVSGSITYRGDLTTIALTPAQLLDLLPALLYTESTDPDVIGNLRYDPATGTLLYVGVMSAADYAFLLNPTVYVLDKNGNVETQPVLDANGNPVYDANGFEETVPVTQTLTLDATQQGLVKQLYQASLTASLGGQGLALAGPGNFDVTANRMDLGVSGGIRVLAPDAALAAISPYGANLNVATAGDLAMTSTIIANQSYAGAVNLNVGGTLDVGGEFTAFDPASVPKGIFTSSGGDISIATGGDVNIDGSRIAAYNGGNVTIESLTGDVNAGVGGSGYVNVSSLILDPATGQLELSPLTGQPANLLASIPGSGILATTLVGSQASLGNILVETPNGNISANEGGIIQISFNNADASKATTELLAGYEMQNVHGRRVSAADLADGTPVLELSDQNLVTLGAAIQVLPAGAAVPLSLVPVLDAAGNPRSDASGHPLYIEASDATRQIVALINNQVQPYLDASGDPITVAKPRDANNQPVYDAFGNPILVIGRNIDASGSGVIAQKIVVKATGGVGGLYVSLGPSPITIQANNFLPGPDGTGPVVYGDGPPVLTTPTDTHGVDPTVISTAGSSAAPPPAAPTENAQTADNASTATTKTEVQDDSTEGADDLNKKKGKGIGLSQKTGRVTVILPAKNMSEKQKPDNSL